MNAPVKPPANALPEWRLDDLYDSRQDPRIEADFDAAAEINGQLAALKGAFVAAKTKSAELGALIDRGIGLYQATTDKLWAIGAYASLASSTARDDPAWARFEADVRTRSSQIAADSLFFTLELNALEDPEIEAALKAHPPAAIWRPWLRRVRLSRPHELSHELERMLLDRGPAVANWVRLYDETLATLVVRSGADKQPTYRTPDIAYHIEKLERGFDLIIDVFGADHIAEHQEVLAAVKALGYDITPIRSIIYQFVTLIRGGEKVKMSTRKATYITLDQLLEEFPDEVGGADVVRFFFLSRKSDSQFDFDLELAKKQAPENPVFYVQYAHARLASIFREGAAKGLALPTDASQIDLNRLGPEEIELAKRALGLPEVMSAAAEALEPHRITFYLLELATEFHRYYNKPANRIIGPDRELSMARMYMAAILKSAIAGGLELLGVSAPERM